MTGKAYPPYRIIPQLLEADLRIFRLCPALNQQFFQTGFRFSMNAFLPSR